MTTPLLSDRIYKFLKGLALYVLPAVSTVYYTLGQIWGFPNTEQVVGSITAVITGLGLLLGLSTRSYNAGVATTSEEYDGEIHVYADEDGRHLTLAVENGIMDVAGKQEVRLKVEQKIDQE